MPTVYDRSKEKVLIGAWCVPLSEILADEKCQWIKDLGVDFISGIQETGNVLVPPDHEKMSLVLKQCEKHGLGITMMDQRVINTPMDRYWTLKDTVSGYHAHPAVWGTLIRDEPGVYDFPRLNLFAKTYRAFDGDKVPFINLFPSYASQEQLGCSSFREYLERYAQEVDVPYLSYDHYPLYGKGDVTWVQDRYLSDFEIASDVCRRYNRQLWYCMQTLGFNRIVREPNEEDLRWQVYCAMSFGVRMLILFTYGTLGDEEGNTPDGETFEEGLITRKGEKTPRYDMMRRVLMELRAVEKAYLLYRHVGNMINPKGVYAAEEEDTVELQFPGSTLLCRRKNNYLELEHPLATFHPITAIDGEGPVMAGCFEKGGEKAFTLVNMIDPGKRKENNVRFPFRFPFLSGFGTWGHARKSRRKKIGIFA